MARYRNIRTGVRSEAAVAQALAEMGFKHVEVHADAQPLHDWIGRPTEVLANVIVRRKELGASSDDIGFVRNENGTLDLVVSDIHLFRFDRKWLAELARRTSTDSIAAGPVQYAAANISHANPAHSKSPPPVPEHGTNVEQRARIEASELLEQAKRGQRLGKLGCSLYFLPLLPWLLLEQSPSTATGFKGLMGLFFVWSLVYFFVVAVVIATRLRRAAHAFQKRFSDREARGAAIAHLRSIALDKQNAAASAARTFLAAVEKNRTVTITRPPPASVRGPGGKAH